MKPSSIVPRWTRIVVGLLALANVGFGISNYLSQSALFQNSTAGVDLASTAAKYASFEFGARNLAIGIALLIVAAVGVPETIAITVIIRALIELQSVVIALIAGTFGAGSVLALVMLAVEVFVIRTMFALVAQRDGT
jgi:hypothetical protein